jgi:uncharacterized LabA/DUF88 family protein
MKTIVYIDAFNLYYGCLKNTPYRWLDLNKLAINLLPKDEIYQIKYFTAKVSARPRDPDQPVRQQIYLRALETLPNLTIKYGHYLTTKVWMPLVTPINGREVAEVFKTEEKGSDVNLATHLIHDGHKGAYELAVVISNDSDLVEPIRIVKDELGLNVGVFNPQMKSKHPSVQLQKTATFFKQIRKSHLEQSLFPDQLQDAKGVFNKPPSW